MLEAVVNLSEQNDFKDLYQSPGPHTVDIDYPAHTLLSAHFKIAYCHKLLQPSAFLSKYFYRSIACCCLPAALLLLKFHTIAKTENEVVVIFWSHHQIH